MPDRPLTNTDLAKYVKKLNIPRFRGVFMRNSMPETMWRSDECAIVNLDTTGGPGTHWVAYVKKNDRVYFFDSLGDLQPPEELQRYFTPRRSVFYNFNRYQEFDTYLCGHLCIMFLMTFMKKKNI